MLFQLSRLVLHKAAVEGAVSWGGAATPALLVRILLIIAVNDLLLFSSDSSGRSRNPG